MSNMSEPVSHYFPPGVVDGNGRRIRPGSLVQFSDAGNTITAEVIGWRIEGLMLLAVDIAAGQEQWFVRYPSDVSRIDSESTQSATVGQFYVEADGPSTMIIECVGTRDLIYIAGTDSDSKFPRLENGASLRDWSLSVQQTLRQMDPDERRATLLQSFAAPIIERVLQEGVLPRVIDRLVLVTTDQLVEHPQDTVYCAQILEMWLEAHSHVVNVGEPDASRRWIESVVIFPITQLPHVIDAVAHKIKTEIPGWAGTSERIVVVHGGGTPAMNTAVLIAASRYSNASIRHIQVPEAHRGTGEQQPLIEFDLEDMPELGSAIKRD
jgi:hypothetical protein